MPYVGKAPLDVYQASDWFKNEVASPFTDPKDLKSKAVKLHIIESLGLRSRNTPLVQYFISIGLYHAEDMAVCIMSVHRKQQNGEKIDLDKIVLTLRTFREQAVVWPISK